jgi:phosphoglycerate dehydrogenase-like enzyme
MQIHIQNPEGGDDFDIDAAQWHAACTRAGRSGDSITVGSTPSAFAVAMQDAEVLVVIPAVLRKLLPLAAPKLKIILAPAAGVEKLAPFDWLPPGIALVNNSGTHGPKTGQFALMALLMLAFRMPSFATQQRAGVWKSIFTPTLDGRHVTIIGTGDLGAAAAQQARRMDMRVTGVRTRAEPHPDFDRVVAVADLDSVLPDSEFLILAAPLTPATAGMISRARLSLLPKDAGLLNVGRGALIDQEALADLLDSGHLSGAILDVTVPEPLPPGHRLWTTKNLVIVPHVSSDNPLTYNRDSLDIFMRNLAARDAGVAMPNLVDTARGY